MFLQGKKAELKEFIISLSKEFSVLSQFTSFVAIEERVCHPQRASRGQPRLLASHYRLFSGKGAG